MAFWGNYGKPKKFLFITSLKNPLIENSNTPRCDVQSVYFVNINKNRQYSTNKHCKSPVKGKIAIITGGARGIGLSIAEEFLKEEADAVILGDILVQEMEKATYILNDKYGEHKALFQPTDVSKTKQMEKLFKCTKERFGRVDILVNNAGILSNQNIEQSINVNVKGLVCGTFLAFQYMSGKGGVIINTAGLEGLQPLYASPVYCGTNHFVIGFTRSMGHEYFYNSTKVKVMAFCPGPTETDLVKNVGKTGDDPMFPNMGQQLQKYYNQRPTQPARSAAKGILSMLNDGENGSIWISKDCKFYKIKVPGLDKVKPIMEEKKKPSVNKLPCSADKNGKCTKSKSEATLSKKSLRSDKTGKCPKCKSESQLQTSKSKSGMPGKYKSFGLKSDKTGKCMKNAGKNQGICPKSDKSGKCLKRAEKNQGISTKSDKIGIGMKNAEKNQGICTKSDKSGKCIKKAEKNQGISPKSDKIGKGMKKAEKNQGTSPKSDKIGKGMKNAEKNQGICLKSDKSGKCIKKTEKNQGISPKSDKIGKGMKKAEKNQGTSPKSDKIGKGIKNAGKNQGICTKSDKSGKCIKKAEKNQGISPKSDKIGKGMKKAEKNQGTSPKSDKIGKGIKNAENNQGICTKSDKSGKCIKKAEKNQGISPKSDKIGKGMKKAEKNQGTSPKSDKNGKDMKNAEKNQGICPKSDKSGKCMKKAGKNLGICPKPDKSGKCMKSKTDQKTPPSKTKPKRSTESQPERKASPSAGKVKNVEAKSDNMDKSKITKSTASNTEKIAKPIPSERATQLGSGESNKPLKSNERKEMKKDAPRSTETVKKMDYINNVFNKTSAPLRSDKKEKSQKMHKKSITFKTKSRRSKKQHTKEVSQERLKKLDPCEKKEHRRKKIPCHYFNQSSCKNPKPKEQLASKKETPCENIKRETQANKPGHVPKDDPCKKKAAHYPNKKIQNKIYTSKESQTKKMKESKAKATELEKPVNASAVASKPVIKPMKNIIPTADNRPFESGVPDYSKSTLGSSDAKSKKAIDGAKKLDPKLEPVASKPIIKPMKNIIPTGDNRPFGYGIPDYSKTTLGPSKAKSKKVLDSAKKPDPKLEPVTSKPIMKPMKNKITTADNRPLKGEVPDSSKSKIGSSEAKSKKVKDGAKVLDPKLEPVASKPIMKSTKNKITTADNRPLKYEVPDCSKSKLGSSDAKSKKVTDGAEKLDPKLQLVASKPTIKPMENKITTVDNRPLKSEVPDFSKSKLGSGDAKSKKVTEGTKKLDSKLQPVASKQILKSMKNKITTADNRPLESRLPDSESKLGCDEAKSKKVTVCVKKLDSKLQPVASKPITKPIKNKIITADNRPLKFEVPDFSKSKLGSSEAKSKKVTAGTKKPDPKLEPVASEPIIKTKKNKVTTVDNRPSERGVPDGSKSKLSSGDAKSQKVTDGTKKPDSKLEPVASKQIMKPMKNKITTADNRPLECRVPDGSKSKLSSGDAKSMKVTDSTEKLDFKLEPKKKLDSSDANIYNEKESSCKLGVGTTPIKKAGLSDTMRYNAANETEKLNVEKKREESSNTKTNIDTNEPKKSYLEVKSIQKAKSNDIKMKNVSKESIKSKSSDIKKYNITDESKKLGSEIYSVKKSDTKTKLFKKESQNVDNRIEAIKKIDYSYIKTKNITAESGKFKNQIKPIEKSESSDTNNSKTTKATEKLDSGMKPTKKADSRNIKDNKVVDCSEQLDSEYIKSKPSEKAPKKVEDSDVNLASKVLESVRTNDVDEIETFIIVQPNKNKQSGTKSETIVSMFKEDGRKTVWVPKTSETFVLKISAKSKPAKSSTNMGSNKKNDPSKKSFSSKGDQIDPTTKTKIPTPCNDPKFPKQFACPRIKTCTVNDDRKNPADETDFDKLNLEKLKERTRKLEARRELEKNNQKLSSKKEDSKELDTSKTSITGKCNTPPSKK